MATTITNAKTWTRRDLIALATDALATYGDDPRVVQAAQAAQTWTLDPLAWLTLGDIGRQTLKAELDDRMSDAALDRLLKDLGGLDPDLAIIFVDPDGDPA